MPTACTKSYPIREIELPAGSRHSFKVDLGVRILILLAGVGVWIALQWLLDLIVPDITIDFMRSGIIGLLAAAPLLIVQRFLPLRFGLLRSRRVSSAAAVLFAVTIPFIAVGFAQDISWTYPGTEWFAVAAALFLLASAEEMVFRGFLLNTLSFGGKLLPGVLLSSALFAVVHFDNTGATLFGVINVAIIGVLLSLVRFLSGGLVLPSVIHWLWNLMTGMVFGWKVSGYTLPSLFKPGLQNMWGSFGPEGSILLTVSLAAGIAAAVLTLRRHSLL